jgi:hypothetical protein
MKYLEKWSWFKSKYVNREANESLNEDSAYVYIGCDLEDALNWSRGISKPTDTSSLYPFDWDVVEFSLGGSDEMKSMSQEEIDEFIKNICSWYDGSRGSVSGGLNALGNFTNAEGYGEFILGIEAYCPIAQFSDDYLLIKDADKVEIIFVYDKETEKFYEPKDFELIYTANKYNL